MLTSDWAAHGDAAIAVSIPAMRCEVPAAALEAAGFDRVLERLLPALPPRTRTILQLATILGPRLNDASSFKLLNLTPAQTTAGITELLERRVLRDAGTGLEFTNELIRARLYLKIPAAVRKRLHEAVAEGLLTRTAAGESIPGLEVAWHCIRARRSEEATPFLMTGARAAIMHGAPDEAARALSSALGQLKGQSRNEAALLLAETYQEMAQWKEALVYLKSLDEEHIEPALLQLAEVLQIESCRWLDVYDTTQLEQIAQSLLPTVRNGATSRIRARASLVASGISADLRNSRIMEETWMTIRGLHLDDFDNWDRSKVLLAQAHTSYQMRSVDIGLGEARAAARLLEERALRIPLL